MPSPRRVETELDHQPGNRTLSWIRAHPSRSKPLHDDLHSAHMTEAADKSVEFLI